MRHTPQWEALPPPAKLCLKIAQAHDGLIKVERTYAGRANRDGTAPRFTALVVATLMREGLATSDRRNARRVVLRPAAHALLRRSGAAA